MTRIAEREAVIGAWHHLDQEAALDAAAARDREAVRGPLHGIPIAVKDIIETADMPTDYGSSIHQGHRTGQDAAAVATLRSAGAIILGKTVTTEFAYFRPGKTANPHNHAHTPGGSSSGSAAAVADNMVPVAFGTQTAGSIIRPAAFCGVVGYKPTFGSFSLAGIKGLSPSLDTLGLLARSVLDIAAVSTLLHGAPDSQLPPASKLTRFGICRTAQWTQADEASRHAVERAAAIARAAGACVEEFELPAAFAGLVDAQKTVMAYEAARSLAHERLVHREKLSLTLLQLLESGLAISHESYRSALIAAEHSRCWLDDLLSSVDAILTPAAVGEAPQGLDATGDPVFSRMWTLLHVPCLTLPASTGPLGLPVGVQLIARRWADAQLLIAAEWLETALSKFPRSTGIGRGAIA